MKKFEIEKQFAKNFKCKEHYSDFEINALEHFTLKLKECTVTPDNIIWVDGKLWWDEDKGGVRWATYLTESSIMMLWNTTTEELYRIEF